MSTGPYKGAFIEGAPVTEAQLADEQRVVNEIHQMFLAAVERGRGTPVGGVDDGRVWLAQQAGEQFGLVDAVGDYESALSVINKRMNDMEADRFQAFAAKPENNEKIMALNCVVSAIDAARTEAAAQAKAEAIADIKARIDAAEGDAKLAFELASVEEITSTIAARKAAAEKAAIDAKLAEADKLKVELDAARADLARERANKIAVVGTTSAVSEGVAVNTVQADPDPASIAAAEWESASEAERLTWASREVYVAYRTKTNSK
jgi:ClpP class serine protease